MSVYPYDPFTEVLNALWRLLESDTTITSMVSTKNRIKLTEGSVKPREPDRHTTSDLPEIRIEPAGGQIEPAVSSGSSRATQVYRITMADGNLLVHKSYFPLKWAIFKALVRIDANLGLDYVRRITLGDDFEDRNEQPQGHPGWNCGLDITVEMWFSREQLKT